MNELPSKIKRLREVRKERDSTWTQGYVASKIGVARVTYTAYENGTKTPPPDIIVKLASVFNVSTDYLLGHNTSDDNEDHTKAAIIDKIKNEFSDADLMFEDMESLTAEQLQEVYNFIKFKKGQN